MNRLNIDEKPFLERRQRLHELVIALIHNQKDLELMDSQSQGFESSENSLVKEDPARWLDKNKRILSRYQSLVRSAITLDALLDAEDIESV